MYGAQRKSRGRIGEIRAILFECLYRIISRLDIMILKRLWFVSFLSVFGSLFIGTQLAAWWYSYDPALGKPLFYTYHPPWRIIEWSLMWGNHEPGVLIIAGMTAVMCLLFFYVAFMRSAVSSEK